MRVLIVGGLGNMGRRYAAILNAMNIDFNIYDSRVPRRLEDVAVGCDRAIIATPTDTHFDSLIEVIDMINGPILCEKPVCKDIDQLKTILRIAEEKQRHIRMVMQYKYVFRNPIPGRDSHYDFYHHGNDGLYWDCMQIIGLATGKIVLKEDSHTWKCSLNGEFPSMNENTMNLAYFGNIFDWINHPELCVGPEEILSIHEKVLKYAADQES